MDDIFCLLHHLALCDPEGSFGNGGGEVVDLDTVELMNGDLNGVEHAHDDLVFEEQGEDFVFQAAQGEVAFREEVAGPAGGVYKDVIFDTSPVAGKVYKNSENRRKQGVSCGFRCICRCSICPVRAQPWCARC